MKSKRHSARYFDWIDDLEGPPCARDALEDAFFLPAVESAARVAAWLAQWGSALDPTAVALIEAIPALFDGRTRDVAARVSFLERESARSSVSALTAEALFLAALARWRLEQPEGHWQAVLEDPRISKEPRVRARCLVEVAAARMNLGGLIDALAGIEAAASLAHAWDGWARTRALTVQFTSHLYLGDHAEAKRLLGELRPRGARDAKAPSVQLAHVRRALALAQERESLVEARRLLAAARGVGSGAALSRLLVDKETLRIALRAEKPQDVAALLSTTEGERPALVSTASEQVEALFLSGRASDAYAFAQRMANDARSSPNVLLRAELLVLCAEAALLAGHEQGATGLARAARAHSERHGFGLLALRAGIVEALFTRDERALALVSKEAQARKLPLLRARLGLLRARLGLAPDPEREIAGAWETLLREDASCLRADAFLARTQARVAFALVPVEEGSSSAPSMSSALKGMPVAHVDAQAVALLRSSACVVWFEEGGILLAFDPDKETTFRLETRTGTLLDALMRTLLEAQGTGCTLAKLHSCRSVVPFRAESHAATLHVALARLRARILPCGLHVAHDARTGRYRIASERRFFRHVRHWASERSDSGTRDRQARALGTSDAFAARQKEILTLLENETFASTARLCEALGVTRQSLRPYLDALAREGVLHRWGKGPATRYALSP